MGRKRHVANVVASGSLLLALSACGTAVPPPTARATSSRDAVARAMATEPDPSSAAAFYLHRAQEELALGTALMDEGENERAAWLLARAQADAELALALGGEDDVGATEAEVRRATVDHGNGSRSR